jgi:hypothetical protein
MKKHEPEAGGVPFPFRPRLDRQGRLEVAQVVAFFQRHYPDAKRKDWIAAAAKQCGVSVRHVRAAFSEFEDIAVANVKRLLQQPAAEKRKRGRPKGTNKLPGDHLLHLLELCRLRPARMPLSQWCREGVNGAHLFDPETWQAIPVSKDWRTLRSRLVEAQKLRRDNPHFRTVAFPNDTPSAFVTARFGFGTAQEKAIENAVRAAGTTYLRVPPLKARRKRVAALSKLFAGSETKLHK